VRTGGRTTMYEEHSGAVNTITFYEGGNKFISSSDDKKIFV
jgi:pre-mRNA-processing factor 17